MVPQKSDTMIRIFTKLVKETIICQLKEKIQWRKQGKNCGKKNLHKITTFKLDFFSTDLNTEKENNDIETGIWILLSYTHITKQKIDWCSPP